MTERVTFRSGEVDCVGHWYGHATAGVRPCVVLCAGFTGTQDTPSIVATAQAFAAAGHLALTFDYRNFGLSGGEPRQVVDVPGQLQDVAAAVAAARGHSGVDPDGVVLWGTSLGGGHAVTVAAGDPRIAAVVAQVPFNGFPRRVGGRSSRATVRLLAAMVTDALRGALGRGPSYIPVVGGPGDLAVMASAEAQRAVEAMDSPTWRNEVAPRSLLGLMRYEPGDRAADLRMPLLVSIGEHDRETLGEDTAELAQKAPRGSLRTYPWAHFDFYRPEVRATVVADQLDFLRGALAS